MRSPATLLPATAARLLGFALLAGLAALEWSRMAEPVGPGRALSWVAVAVLAAAALAAAERRHRPVAIPAALGVGVCGAIAASGIELRLLAPKRWPELGEGLARGAEALAASPLPYAGREPWAAQTLEAAGAGLVLMAAYLAFWPRAEGRGSPVAAVAILLSLIVTPVAAMSTAAPLVLGVAAAVATGCFLFLERLPVRPGAGAVALACIAVAVALPLGVAADRDEPWFDYRAFAERLGPVQPVEFSWEHGYGPIDWPRDGRELFRAKSEVPVYWKAETLDGFRADRWRSGTRRSPAGIGVDAELPYDHAERPGWTRRAEVTLRRLETPTLVGPGTILSLEATEPRFGAEWTPGRWVASRELGRGDSYTVEAHVPQPTAEQLAAATVAAGGRQAAALRLTLPIERAPRGRDRRLRPRGAAGRRYAGEVDLSVPEWGSGGRPRAHYEIVDVAGDGVEALRRTGYRRTWRLARRLRSAADGPWDYVLRVGELLASRGFRYDERPPEPRPGVPPLEAFLHDDRAGYCQQYSGAMALLLRMGGVPARVAAGFTPGGYRRTRREWVIRDTDAHSWVEVWLDGIGWVTVDPTPAATPARSQVAALQVPDDGEEDEAAPPPPDDGSQPAARRPEGAARDPVAAAAPPDGDAAPRWPLVVVAVVLGASGLALAARRRRARRPVSETDLLEVVRALRRSGRPVGPGTTLSELERRLGGSPYLRKIRAARYAARHAAPTAAERADFRRELASGLGWSGRLRALWAVPPRPGPIRFPTPGDRRDQPRLRPGPDSSDG